MTATDVDTFKHFDDMLATLQGEPYLQAVEQTRRSLDGIVVVAPAPDGQHYFLQGLAAKQAVVECGCDFLYESTPLPEVATVPAAEMGQLVDALVKGKFRYQLAVPGYMLSSRAERGSIITPQVGMPATVHVGSDDYPTVVTDINRSGNTVTLAGIAHGEPQQARKDKNGTWRLWGKKDGYQVRWPVAIGMARFYSDPSF